MVTQKKKQKRNLPLGHIAYIDPNRVLKFKIKKLI